MNNRKINNIFFILGGIPLALYPFVIIADIMLLAAESNPQSVYVKVLAYLFLILSSTYLLTYLACLFVYSGSGEKKRILSIIPLMQLLFTVIVCFIWSLID
ncbi:hypothetical protein [Paenibacillus sp. GCM10027629]|uniref:hypothetical protein n=1 Tax=Paenibacillus sp. GCM10027629 TaxID=3273414 RepID=UPI0036D2CBCF